MAKFVFNDGKVFSGGYDLSDHITSVNLEIMAEELDATTINSGGSSSVRQVIYNNKTLGLSDTDARVVNMTNYAADVNLNGIDGVGANLTIEVYTKGSS